MEDQQNCQYFTIAKYYEWTTHTQTLEHILISVKYDGENITMQFNLILMLPTRGHLIHN